MHILLHIFKEGESVYSTYIYKWKLTKTQPRHKVRKCWSFAPDNTSVWF